MNKAIFLILLLPAIFFAQDLMDIWNYDSIADYGWMEVETLWTSDTTYLDMLGSDMVNLSVGEIRYSSFGADSGELRIQAFFAYPSGSTDIPGFVVNHGIIMDGELEMAMTFAAGIQSFALAISAPGHGESDGGSAYHLPNLVWSYPDPRNNHFYQFAYATMRGLNYIEALPMIDNDWTGAIGFSGGADAAFIAAGVDSRIELCVPIIPQTDFECCAEDSGWMINVLEETGISSDDSNVVYLQRYISPINYADYFSGFTMMIVGAQDEFEPIDCATSTFASLNPENSRFEIVANFDHHCYYTPYGLMYDYDSFDNTSTFYSKILGITNTVLFRLRDGISIPQIPTAYHILHDDTLEIRAEVGAEFFSNNDLKLWYSIDSAWTFQSMEMSRYLGFDEQYHYIKIPRSPEFELDNLIYYVEAKSLPFFWLSSLAYVPEDMKFNLRPFPYEFFGLAIHENKTPKPNNTDIIAYPNPFNSACYIKLNPNTTIEIFDIEGKSVYREENNRDNGYRLLRWRPSANLSSGIYFIKQKGGVNSFEKIIYAK
ncbi:MAG: T9SS type A sorting domain-containing protein [Candidatus Zixiibacteriota bacterium]